MQNVCVGYYFKIIKNAFLGVNFSITFLHFTVTTLDLLNFLPKLGQAEVDTIINWIYYLQIKTGKMILPWTGKIVSL